MDGLGKWRWKREAALADLCVGADGTCSCGGNDDDGDDDGDGCDGDDDDDKTGRDCGRYDVVGGVGIG